MHVVHQSHYSRCHRCTKPSECRQGKKIIRQYIHGRWEIMWCAICLKENALPTSRAPQIVPSCPLPLSWNKLGECGEQGEHGKLWKWWLKTQYVWFKTLYSRLEHLSTKWLKTIYFTKYIATVEKSNLRARLENMFLSQLRIGEHQAKCGVEPCPHQWARHDLNTTSSVFCKIALMCSAYFPISKFTKHVL